MHRFVWRNWKDSSGINQCYSWSSICFGRQEFEKDQEVPERMGAAATGEDDQDPRGQDAGWRRRAEDGVYVQAQLIQDGLCVQVRGLHVQAHRTDPGSSGRQE